MHWTALVTRIIQPRMSTVLRLRSPAPESGCLGLSPSSGWHLTCGTVEGDITSVSVLIYKIGTVMGKGWNLAGAENVQSQLSLVPSWTR